MPLTAMLFVYSICILTGIFLVLKGFSLRSSGEGSPQRSQRTSLAEGVDALADLDEAVPLQFLEENQPSLRRMSDGTEPCTRESSLGDGAVMGDASRQAVSFLASLKRPFRAFRRKEREPVGGITLDEPISDGIVLNPRSAGNQAAPDQERNKP